MIFALFALAIAAIPSVASVSRIFLVMSDATSLFLSKVMRASRHTSAARGKTQDAQFDLRTIFHSPKPVGPRLYCIYE